jgi:hypothetical protein
MARIDTDSFQRFHEKVPKSILTQLSDKSAAAAKLRYRTGNIRRSPSGFLPEAYNILQLYSA